MKKTLRVGKSQIHGKGLFATKKISKGTVIGYCDAVPSRKQTDYTLHVEDGTVDVTCCLKYINHNNRPNVVYYDDLSVVALRDIKPGEELTHHYGDDWK
ncbi:MAG: SET domain-containing protein-lysine N-methyltransferase [Spirochaetes bacterium]|nr:SET domain-containing protein-lysine N-methyltransferase [Spirochaetota bacterium]MBN2772057.1 SET domain-containing protein-lysine N-methyltransferase [Spirochaetota bacterium]